jgi:putative NADH-flavin reductase
MEQRSAQNVFTVRAVPEIASVGTIVRSYGRRLGPGGLLMKIVVFGASGGTGQELVRQGLAMGHEVTAFVRRPESLASEPRVCVVAGDALDGQTVARAIAGQDVVLSALGSRSLRDSTLLPEAMVRILPAMKRHGVKRLIVLGASGAWPGAARRLSRPAQMVLSVVERTLLKRPFESQRAMQELIRRSDTEWTVVQPPRLLNSPGRGRYRLDADGLPADGTSIARADVAAFMLAQLTSDEWVRKSPFVAW